MIEFELDVSDVDEFVKQLEQMPRIMNEEIERGMNASMDIFNQLVKGSTPVNTGTLRSSIQSIIKGRKLNWQGRLTTPLLYGEVVEFGRRAGKQPPTDAIKMWVIRKGIASGKEADSVAYLIARKIGKRGTRGAFMFTAGFDDGKPIVERFWQTVPARIVGRMEQ